MTLPPMLRRALILLVIGVTLEPVSASAQSTGRARLSDQLAQDFTAGRVPSSTEIEDAERESAANPTDLSLMRRLAKGYFFQYFGGGNGAAYSKSVATFDRALSLSADDPESLVYQGAVIIFFASRNGANDVAQQKASFEKGFALVQKAERVAPRHGAVVSIASAAYLELPTSYGMAPQVIGMLEGMRKGMGPAWDKFSHHGKQRLLFTLGRAHAMTGNLTKARASFDEALAVNETSPEAGLIRAELRKHPGA